MKAKIFFCIAVNVLVLIGGKCFAQGKIIGVHLVTRVINQYEKAEWNIVIKADYTNPYDAEQVRLDMMLRSPSGKQLNLPCYYDKTIGKNGTWIAAFSPREAGMYHYYFKLKTKGVDSSATNGFTAHLTPKPGFLHANDLWTLKFDNGELFRGIGENIGWEARSFENQKYTYEYFLPKLKQNGGNFFRTWMCNWNMPMEWKTVQTSKRWNKRYENSTEYYHLKGMARMDQLVHLCDSLGLYFMLTLNWHGDLREEDYWPISEYNTVNGGPAKTPTEFFTSPKAKAMFKNRLRYIIARWGYSTSIAAWEMFNEIDNAAFRKMMGAGGAKADSIVIPHRYITQWHDEMSRYIKETDPYGHIVTTSISHRPIAGLFNLKDMDLNQLHLYKKTDSIPFAITVNNKTHQKPFDVGEFGFRYEDADPKYTDGYLIDLKKGMWYGLFSPTPILPMTWWWEFFDKHEMTTYFKSIQAINLAMFQDGAGKFERVMINVEHVTAMGVKCGRALFVYLHCEDPRMKSTKITLPAGFAAGNTVTAYDPERNEYTPVRSLDNVALLPGGNTILIIKPATEK